MEGEKKKMNFLEQVSYAARHGQKKAREEFAKQDELEEIKKKRQKAVGWFGLGSDQEKEG